MGDIVQRMKCRIADWDDEEPRADWWTERREYAEAAETILALRKEVEGLKAYARDISKAITHLSAGAGSEWFKPVGDDHFVDPAFAAERLSTMLANGRDAKRQLIRERRAAHQAAGEP